MLYVPMMTVLFCALLAIGVSACAGRGSVSLARRGDMIVLMDRSDPDVEMRVAFWKSHVVFNIVGFPGYKERRVAVLEDVRHDLRDRAAKLGREFSSTRTFEPPGPLFAINVIRNGQLMGSCYFEDDDKEFETLAKDIRRRYQASSATTYALPEWFLANRELCRLFGINAAVASVDNPHPSPPADPK